MFQKAYDIASKFTLPLVVTIRFYDKTVESGLGSFIVLNNDGWLLSVAHNFDAFMAYNQHQKEIATYKDQVDKINATKNISRKEKTTIKKVQANL